MVLMAWSPSWAALSNLQECALLQVGPHPDVILGVVKGLFSEKVVQKCDMMGLKINFLQMIPK